jgi:frataxin-like iron-binding protein CyaY
MPLSIGLRRALIARRLSVYDTLQHELPRPHLLSGQKRSLHFLLANTRRQSHVYCAGKGQPYSPFYARRSLANSNSPFESEEEFNIVADDTFETIWTIYDTFVPENDDFTHYDLLMGTHGIVLELHYFKQKGAWRIKKEIPEQMLYWESSLSGPRYFTYNGQTWISKDGLSLGPLLVAEVCRVFPHIDKIELEYMSRGYFFK